MPRIDDCAARSEPRARLRRFFPGRSRVFLTVVHVRDDAQAVANVEFARDAGADGVFLINHGMGHQNLLSIAGRIAAADSAFFVGVNCLDLPAEAVFSRLPEGVHGVWTDNAGINSGDEYAAPRIRAAQLASGWDGLHVGGVAFKYQPLAGTAADAARCAIDYVDVITTSGPGTGKPPLVGKIEAMRSAIGDHPLAIASGITPENVGDYLPLVDCFLVATGISENFHDLDPERVRMLASRIGDI